MNGSVFVVSHTSFYPLLWGLEVAVLQYMALLRTYFLLNCHIVVVHSVQKLQCEMSVDVE